MIDDMRVRLERSVLVLEQKLVELAQQTDAANLFTAVVANYLLTDGVANSPGQNLPELDLLAYFLFPYFGPPSDKIMFASESQQCWTIIAELYPMSLSRWL